VVEIEVEVPSKQRHCFIGEGPPSSGGASRRQPDRSSRRLSPYTGKKSPHHRVAPGPTTTGLSSALNGVALDSLSSRTRQGKQGFPSQQRQQPPTQVSEAVTRLTDGGVAIARQSAWTHEARVQRKLQSQRMMVERQYAIDAPSVGHSSVDEFRETAKVDFLRRNCATDRAAARPPRPSTSPPIRTSSTTHLYLPRCARTAPGRLPALSQEPLLLAPLPTETPEDSLAESARESPPNVVAPHKKRTFGKSLPKLPREPEPPPEESLRIRHLVRRAKLKPGFEWLSSP